MSQDPTRKNSRRDFLTGQAAVDAFADLTHGVGANSSAAGAIPRPLAAAPPAYLLEIGRRAMACEFQVFLNAGQHPYGADAALKALDLVDALEDQLTVYRDHSEVSRLNRRAAAEPVVVETRLFALLQLAKQLHQETDGTFDITTGPLTKTWGFYRRAGRFPAPEEITAALAQVGSQWLTLDEHECSVFFAHPQLELNLGAIGKGYTLDRCAELLAAEGITHYMIHGGMSSILARGERTTDGVDAQSWRVALRNPTRLDERIAEIHLRDRALGTSGAGTQFFYHNGKRYGHILDPRSGYPANVVLSSTVLAPTAAVADALATAFYVLGADATARYCERHPEISALLVVPGAKSGASEILPINLAASEWQAYPTD